MSVCYLVYDKLLASINAEIRMYLSEWSTYQCFGPYLPNGKDLQIKAVNIQWKLLSTFLAFVGSEVAIGVQRFRDVRSRFLEFRWWPWVNSLVWMSHSCFPIPVCFIDAHLQYRCSVEIRGCHLFAPTLPLFPIQNFASDAMSVLQVISWYRRSIRCTDDK